MRRGIKALALLALCFTAMLPLGGCGGDEQDSPTAPSAAKEVPEPSSPKPSDSAQPKPSAPQQAARDHTESVQKKGVKSTPKGSRRSPEGSGDNPSEGEKTSPSGRPPADLTDEEVCERDPAGCSSEPPALDPSNPDSRRAQKRGGETAGVPPDCHTRDCEKARAAEG